MSEVTFVNLNRGLRRASVMTRIQHGRLAQKGVRPPVVSPALRAQHLHQLLPHGEERGTVSMPAPDRASHGEDHDPVPDRYRGSSMPTPVL